MGLPLFSALLHTMLRDLSTFCFAGLFFLISLSQLSAFPIDNSPLVVGRNVLVERPSTIVKVREAWPVNLQGYTVSADAIAVSLDDPLDSQTGNGVGELFKTITSGAKVDPQARRQLKFHNKETLSAENTREDEVQESRLKDNVTKDAEYNELRESVSLFQTMQNQIKLAKSFISFARMSNRHRLLRDLKVQIRDSEEALGDSLMDADLPKSAAEKMKAMGRVLAKARDQKSKCEALVKKLRSLLLANEKEVQALKEEGAFLDRLAARTMPKGLHCLALQLTILFYNQATKILIPADERKLEDPQLYHYAIFTENILAASVVVNSTIFHAKDKHKQVFHIVTDGLNYAAMKMWFYANAPRNAAVEVKNIDDLSSLHLFAARRKLARKSSKPDFPKHSFVPLRMRQRSLESSSKFDEVQFYLPEVFPNLDKILLLDDHIVVQKDLTGLWKENLYGKVSGAVKSCATTNRHLGTFLNVSTAEVLNPSDPNVWLWRYCLNMFDLEEWKRQKLTEIYQKWSLSNQAESLWQMGTLSPQLISFYNNTHTLDNFWHVRNLDGTPNMKQDEFQNAAALQYSGYVKPWLEMSTNTKYRSFWTKFLDYDNPILQKCNISK